MISDPWYKSQKPWPFWPGLDGVSRMQTIVCLLPSEFRDTFRSRVAPQLELTARRHRPTTMKRKRRITEAFPWDTSPRSMIRIGCTAPCHGHRGRGDGAASALAEPVRGKGHRGPLRRRCRMAALSKGKPARTAPLGMRRRRVCRSSVRSEGRPARPWGMFIFVNRAMATAAA